MATEQKIPVEEMLPAWDPNPLVVVSRRTRNFRFPSAILKRDPTKEDLERWYAPEALASARDEKVITFHAGITFLGSLTTVWQYKNVDRASDAPQDAKGRPLPPHVEKTLLVYPISNVKELFDTQQFRTKGSKSIRADEFGKSWVRVARFLKDRDDELVLNGGLGIFTAAGGFDAPEVMLMPLKEVLEHRTDLGNQAYAMALGSIPTHRNATHMGALHDYAVHYPQSWNLVEACRTRIRAWKDAQEA